MISHRESLISIVYLACMITVHGLILGRHKLVSEPTACRTPLPTPWSKSSLAFAKILCSRCFFREQFVEIGGRLNIVVVMCCIDLTLTWGIYRGTMRERDLEYKTRLSKPILSLIHTYL